MTARAGTDRTTAAAVDDDRMPSRNVRVGGEWDDAKVQTGSDKITIAVVVRAALADYLTQRRAGGWPAWLPRPARSDREG